MSTTQRIARIILKGRALLKMKQDALARLVGRSRSYISKVEQGNILPSSQFAAAVEKALRLKKGRVVGIIVQIKTKERALKKQAIWKARNGDGAKKR